MGTMLIGSVFSSVARTLPSRGLVVVKHPQDTLVCPLVHSSRLNWHGAVPLGAKYSAAERKYSVPLECLRDFFVDLQRLQAFNIEHPAENLDQDASAHQDIDSNKSGE